MAVTKAAVVKQRKARAGKPARPPHPLPTPAQVEALLAAVLAVVDGHVEAGLGGGADAAAAGRVVAALGLDAAAFPGEMRAWTAGLAAAAAAAGSPALADALRKV